MPGGRQVDVAHALASLYPTALAPHRCPGCGGAVLGRCVKCQTEAALDVAGGRLPAEPEIPVTPDDRPVVIPPEFLRRAQARDQAARQTPLPAEPPEAADDE